MTLFFQVLASGSGQGNGDSRCQIRIWNVQEGTCQKVLFHHETQVQAMAYSWDDRFLVTLGQYACTYKVFGCVRILLRTAKLCRDIVLSVCGLSWEFKLAVGIEWGLVWRCPVSAQHLGISRMCMQYKRVIFLLCVRSFGWDRILSVVDSISKGSLI